MNKEQKQKILFELGKIVESKKTIDKIVAKVPHTNGIVTLKPKNTLIYRPHEFLVDYQHTDGKLYQINIHELCRG